MAEKRHIGFDSINSGENQVLHEGNVISSNSRNYFATLDNQGNLLVYVSAHFVSKNILWSSQTNGKGDGPYHLNMQSDGNAVVYDKHNHPVWSSDTWNKGKGPYRLTVQDDGNLVLYDSQGAPHCT